MHFVFCRHSHVATQFNTGTVVAGGDGVGCVAVRVAETIPRPRLPTPKRTSASESIGVLRLAAGAVSEDFSRKTAKEGKAHLNALTAFGYLKRINDTQFRECSKLLLQLRGIKSRGLGCIRQGWSQQFSTDVIAACFTDTFSFRMRQVWSSQVCPPSSRQGTCLAARVYVDASPNMKH